jgi:hypothetical protein
MTFREKFTILLKEIVHNNNEHGLFNSGVSMLKMLLALLTIVAMSFAATGTDTTKCAKDKKNCCPKTKTCPMKQENGKCPMMDSSKGSPFKAEDSPAKPEKSAVAAKTLAAQKTCPIMGGAINKKYFVDFQGQRIFLCCPGCIDPVKKDPQAAINKLESLGEAPETIAQAKAAK